MRGAAWLALVSLAWLQLTLASHQFDHVAEYFADSCHVCFQLDRIDDAVVDVAVLPPPAPANDAKPEATLRTGFTAGFASAYRSRAPPLL
jgi:hypothetical protein